MNGSTKPPRMTILAVKLCQVSNLSAKENYLSFDSQKSQIRYPVTRTTPFKSDQPKHKVLSYESSLTLLNNFLFLCLITKYMYEMKGVREGNMRKIQV